MSDRKFLLAKAETTYGTDATPNAANVMWAENVQYRLTGQIVRGDPAKPGVGGVAGVLYGEHVEMSFDIPLAGSGAAGTAPKWGAIPKACGWSETISAGVSVTYALAADPQTADSLTLVWNDGRRLHKVLGFRGRCTPMMRGKRLVWAVSGRGLYVPVTTRALPAHADATWTGWYDVNPVAQGRTTVTFDSVNMALREFSVDQSDNVLFRDLPHQENVTLRGARTFTGSMKVTTPLPSAYNFETAWQAQSIKTGSIVHESTAGRIVTINFKVQLGEPSYSEEDGEDVTTVPIRPTPSALNVDDEISVVLT